MDSKKAIILILGLLSMALLFSSEVSARVFTETSSNTKMENIEKINGINKASYVNGGYRGFPYNGGGYSSRYPYNGDGYSSRYPYNGGGYSSRYSGNGGGYFGSYYPGIGDGYPGNVDRYYQGIGGGYYGSGGYRGGGSYLSNGGDYPRNVGGHNAVVVRDILGDLPVVGDVVGNTLPRGGGVVGRKTEDSTRN